MARRTGEPKLLIRQVLKAKGQRNALIGADGARAQIADQQFSAVHARVTVLRINSKESVTYRKQMTYVSLGLGRWLDDFRPAWEKLPRLCRRRHRWWGAHFNIPSRA